jgi:hypothetical protein
LENGVRLNLITHKVSEIVDFEKISLNYATNSYISYIKDPTYVAKINSISPTTIKILLQNTNLATYIDENLTLIR